MMVWGGEREREKGRRTYLVDVLRRVTLRGSTRVREENTREREVWGGRRRVRKPTRGVGVRRAC
jgi:hypothetical protein